MDRNVSIILQKNTHCQVALRKESVDRNIKVCSVVLLGVVALRKESVDRNIIYLLTASAFLMSLSARRAWIEIVPHGLQGLFVSGRSPQGERG